MTRLLHLLHSTASGDLVFYIQPPSTFVFTPPVENQHYRPCSPKRNIDMLTEAMILLRSA
jgi:hypothetical protein